MEIIEKKKETICYVCPECGKEHSFKEQAEKCFNSHGDFKYQVGSVVTIPSYGENDYFEDRYVLILDSFREGHHKYYRVTRQLCSYFAISEHDIIAEHICKEKCDEYKKKLGNIREMISGECFVDIYWNGADFILEARV